MALTDDEKKALAALQKKASEPDDDFDIEIWDETGAGAKVPYSRGRTWLQRFGIDLPDEPEADADEPDDKPARKPRASKAAGGDNVTHAAKYFGNKKTS